MATQSKDKMMGIHELYRPETGEAEVDIVAIHGLNGDAIKTWTADSTGVCWLKHPDYLPKSIPKARILTYGYNANIFSFTEKDPSSDRIHQHAHTLIQELCADRRLAKRQDYPIIFLCHSVGGIIVKRALSFSKDKTSRKTSHLHTIYTCTFGILFFGTPHNGSSESRILGTLQKLASTSNVLRKHAQTESDLVRALREESETLQNINDYFAGMMKRFRIHFFWEQLPTNIGRNKKDYIVSQESAAPISWPDAERAGITADHFNMVKYQSNKAQGFRLVVSALDMYCSEAPDVIQKRYREVYDQLNQEWQNEALEQLRGIRPTVPPPTSVFLGQQPTVMLQSREQFEQYMVSAGYATSLGPRPIQARQAADHSRGQVEAAL
ncbi:uncharacterized protein PV09_07817 [Verruconis gallopava]|uniref:DUF676 domain-containing protein n=1 Tax=Verruconis gallopava TaxID=253628 RepID=A0A0D1XEL2_9PEZI|nr:uncharacterized protein PV09_07817 [Verruconis gallopava]KIW00621.1 hypothetical protein PV09_07817 [Verruconis gallopava]